MKQLVYKHTASFTKKFPRIHLSVFMFIVVLTSSTLTHASLDEDQQRYNCASTVDELGKVSDEVAKLDATACDIKARKFSCREKNILKESYDMQTQFLKWKLENYECSVKN